jgi:hypothetical protein
MGHSLFEDGRDIQNPLFYETEETKDKKVIILPFVYNNL